MVPIFVLGACTGSEPAADRDPVVGPGPQAPDDREHDQPAPCVPRAPAVINEVSPANHALLEDIDGDSVDWVEIHQTGTEPIDLSGWTLSDDASDPGKWTFPAVELAPDGYLLVYASGKPERTVVTWDARVDRGDAWRYHEVTAPPDPEWFLPGFDDRGWPTGPSGFGFGDGDDATEVEASILQVRTTFELTAEEAADLVAADLHVDYDDGFVAYLDGTEIARAGIGSATPWDAWSASTHDAQIPTELPPVVFHVDAARSRLGAGTHTLALEVRNASEASTDLSLVPFLTLGYGTVRAARPSEVLRLGTELHTNFELKASGEQIVLTDPDGCRADAVEPGPLLADESWGRAPDGTGGYFLEPTPGAPNTTESRPGFAPTPTFDPPPGHVPRGTEVRVTAQGSDIRIAWGGAEPTEADPAWDEPLPIGEEGDAVVLRARAWQEGLWPSRVGTATWLFEAPGPLPIVSLVTDPPNLWDEDRGIYVFGPDDYEHEPPYFGANFWEDWERPVHVEEWEPDGSLGFAVDAGISIFGNRSREHDQKSLLVELGSEWGSSTIEHDLFPGLGIASFGRVLLRAGGQDWLGCTDGGCLGAHLRDPVMQGLAAGTGIDVLGYRPAEVWLNGEYWGVYHLSERPDDEYVLAHHGYPDVDLLEQSGNTPIEGDALHWLDTLDYLRTHDPADPAVWARVETLIDVDELASYLAFEVFYLNTDWPGNNIKYWRPRTPDGRWRWLLYDTDFGLGNWHRSAETDGLARLFDPMGTDGNPPWSTELFRLLVQSPEFSTRFVNRFADHLNTALAPEASRDLLARYAAEIAPVVPRQEARWGTWTDGVHTQTLEPGAWEEEVAYIDQWLVDRPGPVRRHLREAFGLGGEWTLTLEADPPGSGTFALAAVEVTPPFEGTYFRGAPVTVTAVPAPGRTFAGWSEAGLGEGPTITVDPDEDGLALTARFD